MVKKIAHIVLIIFITTSVYSQSEGDNDDEYVLDGDEYVISFDSLKTKDKMHYSFEVGAGFGRSSTYGNYFSTYYKPMVSYDVSPRFSINTGIIYVNSSVDNMPIVSEYNYQLFSGSISQYYAFIGGKYKLTDRLSVGGSVFYDFTSYNKYDGTSFNGGSGLDNIGYSANFEYKVSNGLTIQGEIRVNDKNPYRQHSSSFMDGFFIGQDNMFIRQR
ncbi:MAG: hypothetical protein COA97_01370 [Flavobacteriales bacterium]|nr:MAG: hypothetical protein COA97_01370 [Flavobacteriales bacterium]